MGENNRFISVERTAFCFKNFTSVEQKKKNNNMAMCIVDAEYAHHDVYIVRQIRRDWLSDYAKFVTTDKTE